MYGWKETTISYSEIKFYSLINDNKDIEMKSIAVKTLFNYLLLYPAFIGDTHNLKSITDTIRVLEIEIIGFNRVEISDRISGALYCSLLDNFYSVSLRLMGPLHPILYSAATII
jgi:hypothetical protein